MEKKRLHFIDGYKGILCFMIMIGHFWNIYRLTSGASPLDHSFLDAFTKIGTDYLFILATFWLYAFMVISGYLLSFSSIKSVKDILTKTATRFLRLFLPVLGACAIIFLLSRTIGFHADKTADYFKNTWYQKYYTTPFVWKDIFIDAWRVVSAGDSAFNAPFWVIRDMLVTSVLMYICKFVDHLFGKKTHLLPVLFILSALLMDNQVAVACLAGFLIGYYADGLRVLTAKFRNFLCISAVICGVILWLKAEKVLPDLFDNITDYTLIHCFLLITLNRFSVLQRIFSAKPFLLAGKISFGVYSFHWPVICSAGSLVLLAGLENQWHLALTFLSAFAASVVCTVVLSVAYFFTVEKFSDLVIKGVRKLSARLPE